MNIRTRLSLVLALVSVLALTAPALAGNSSLQGILDGHDPATETAGQGGPTPEPQTAAATATAAPGAGQSVLDKLLDRLTSILDRLTKIFQKMVNLFGKKGKADSTPAAADSGKPATSTPKPAPAPKDDGKASTGDSAALDKYKGGKLSPAEFVKLFGPVARESMKKTGVPASVTLAQAALETGWGKSSIGNAKNLFGMKGTGPAGSIRVQTREVYNGKSVMIYDNFRKYNNWRESIDDHARLLSQGSRYKPCMANKNNPDQFARELQKAGYATDPKYAQMLISIMKQYNLYQYDK